MLRARWLAFPKLIRFMIKHFIEGVIIGWTCGLLLIWRDVAGIGSLLAASDGALVTFLLFAQAGLLFGTAHMSVALLNVTNDG